jgi:two-component sensor histidine kinase
MYHCVSTLKFILFTVFVIGCSLPALAVEQSDGAILMEKAAALQDQGDQQQALKLYQQAKSAFESEKDAAGAAKAQMQIARAQIALGDIPSAIASYKQARAHAKRSGLKEAYLKASDALATTYMLGGQLKEALPLLEENLAITKAEGNRSYSSTLMVQLGYTYLQQGQLDTAKILLNEALTIKEELNDARGQAMALSYLGVFYHRLGDYERTLDYYLQSIRHKETIGDSANIALMLKNISSVFIDLENWEKAAEYAQRSYEQASHLGLKRYKAEALSNLALLSLKAGNWQEALARYQEVVAIYRASQNQLHLTDNLLRIGHIYLDQGLWEETKKYFQEAERVAIEVGRQDNRMDVHLAFGQLSLEKGQYTQAIAQLEQAEQIGQANRFRPKMESVFQLLAHAYKARGDYRRSLEYYEAYSALHDSLNNEQQLDRVQEMETRFQLADKEKQISLLNTKTELQGLRLRQSRRRTWFMASLLLLGLAGTLLALYAYRTKRIANLQMAEKNATISKALREKEVLLREIHHRVKNNLQVISSLLKLQSTHLEDPTALTALAEGRSRVQSMALIHQNLYQEDNLTGIYTADYIPKLIETLFHSYNISDSRIELSTDIAPLRLDVDTAIPLGLILNELISNALKHAFPESRPGRLEVALREEKGELHIRVQDDGMGMPTQNQQREASFGFKLIEMLAAKLKAQLTIQTEEGTTILLSIKNYKLV